LRCRSFCHRHATTRGETGIDNTNGEEKTDLINIRRDKKNIEESKKEKEERTKEIEKNNNSTASCKGILFHYSEPFKLLRLPIFGVVCF
jgi:hypothetical protein